MEHVKLKHFARPDEANGDDWSQALDPDRPEPGVRGADYAERDDYGEGDCGEGWRLELRDFEDVLEGRER